MAGNPRTEIVFAIPVPFSAANVRRLAPAANHGQMLMGVAQTNTNERALAIWGLIDTGSAWAAAERGESHRGFFPPSFPTISSKAPGELAISCGGRNVIILRGGAIAPRPIPAFEAGPVFEMFKKPAQQFYAEVCSSLKVERYADEKLFDEVPRIAFIHFFKRILWRISESGHGGTVLLVPDQISTEDVRLTEAVKPKYLCDSDRAIQLLFSKFVNRWKFIHGVHKHASKRRDTKMWMRELINAREAESDLDDDISDWVASIAALAQVDGAVLITDWLRVRGFGAEVIASSATLREVLRAMDAKATSGTSVPIVHYGTRHRSAFRFCSSFEQGAAFVMSQDGGVKAVKRVGPNVVFWEDVDLRAKSEMLST